MKYVLISMALYNMQPVYSDKATCEEAMTALQSRPSYEDAVCIPMPEGSVRENERNKVMNDFFDMIERLAQDDQ